MKIIAQQNNEVFLVLSKDNKDPLKRIGFVVDMKRESIFPKQQIEVIMKFGYWEDYEGTQDLLKEFKKYKKRK